MQLIIMDNALFSLFFSSSQFPQTGVIWEESQWLLRKQIRLFTGLVSLPLIHEVPNIPST